MYLRQREREDCVLLLPDSILFHHVSTSFTMLSSGIGVTYHQPVHALVHARAVDRRTGYDGPVAVPELAQLQRLRNVCCALGSRLVLLVGKDQQRRVLELVLVQHARQLIGRRLQPLNIRRVNHKHNGRGIRIVAPPVRPNRCLAAEIPHVKIEVFVRHRLHVEANSRNRRDDLTNLQPVQKCRLAGVVLEEKRKRIVLAALSCTVPALVQVLHATVAVYTTATSSGLNGWSCLPDPGLRSGFPFSQTACSSAMTCSDPSFRVSGARSAAALDVLVDGRVEKGTVFPGGLYSRVLVSPAARTAWMCFVSGILG